MVAIAAHFAALADGRDHLLHRADQGARLREVLRPVRDLRRRERRHADGRRVGQRRAPIICCTAEVLANIALREGADADIGQVVMDEFHFYAEPQRGWAWQVPLLTPAAGAVPADVGDARRRHRAARGPDAPHRPRDRARRRRRAPGAAALLVVAGAAARAARGAGARRPGAGLRRALHAGLGAGARAVAAVGEALHARGARRDRRRDRRLPLHRRASARRCPSSSAAGIGVHHAGHAARATGGSSSSSPRPGC